MKILVFFILVINLFAIEYRGNISTEYNKYYNTFKSSSAIKSEIELKKDNFFLHLKAIKDFKNKKRRYFDLNEFYYTKSFDDYDLIIGKSIKFWGALELYNLTDIFNSKDTLDDMSDKDKKLGSWNISLIRYFDESEVSFIVKFKEEYQDYILKNYSKKFISEKSKYHPSYFLKYSGSEGDRDFAYIFMSGYDNFRDKILKDYKIKQYLFLVNKFLTYQTLVKDDILYKLEFAYTDIKNYKKIDNYYEAGVGVEKTIYSFWDKKDLGLLVEYYKSDINQKIIFQNDFFLGFRISFNDTDSSEIVGGVIRDFDFDKDSYSLEIKKRVFEDYKIKVRFIKDEIKLFKFEIGYYF